MAKAKKLPSGQWRSLVYDYTDGHGKRHYESFTAASRRESEYMAAQFALMKRQKSRPESMTVQDALEKYISAKRQVISPSTLRGYLSMQRNCYDYINTINLRELTNEQLQTWVGLLSSNHSPKTVRNAHGLLSAALDMFLPDFRVGTSLPQKSPSELYVPSDDNIKTLLSRIVGTDLEIAVYLAAFGPLRRGEICALTSKDIKGNIITVNKSMVLTPNNQWLIKSPKTLSSHRDILFPDFVINRISGIEGQIIKMNPSQITTQFSRTVRRSGLPYFRFHDLRHYSASIMHAIGTPDQYIMSRGGWATDNVMKSVYRNVIDIEAVKQNKKINSHFEKMQHEMQHKSKNSL